MNLNKRLYLMLAFLVGCTTVNTGSGPASSGSKSSSNKSAGDQREPGKVENIPLVWKPTAALGAMGMLDVADLDDVRLQVDPFADNRENRGAIGQNIEKMPRKVSTPDDVSAFVSDQMKSLISQAGIDVVSSGATAMLKGEVKQFFVDETEIYHGNVRLRLTLSNPVGEILWTGTIRGSAIRFGRSYKAENYYEALSDSLIDATYHLVQDPGFRKALARTDTSAARVQ